MDNLLRNHHVGSVVDGEVVLRRATCAEFSVRVAPHVRTVVNGEGDASETRTVVVGCADAESELVALRCAYELALAKISELEEQNAAFEDVIQSSLQIIFDMGPALQRVIKKDLAPPVLTDDKSAVRLDSVTGALFAVILDPYRRRIFVRDSRDGGVEELKVNFPQGRLTTDQQTMIIGHIERIRVAAETGVDPVAGMVDFMATVDAVARYIKQYGAVSPVFEVHSVPGLARQHHPISYKPPSRWLLLG